MDNINRGVYMAKVSEATLEKKAEKEIKALETIENEMTVLQLALADNEQFQKFLQYQEDFNAKSASFFKKLEKEMIDNGIEKINLKSNNGKDYIRITTRNTYKVVDEDLVPEEYKKEVTKVEIDMAEIKADAELSGELPEGVELVTSQFLQKKISTVKALG